MISEKIKKLFKNFFSNYNFFYTYLGNRLIIAFTLSLLVGVMDGFGLAMFLPLLQMIGDGNGTINGENTLGNLDYLLDGLMWVGLPMTLPSILLVMLFFFSMKGIFRFLESYYSVILMTVFIKKVRFEAIDNITHINYKYFVQIDSGRIQNTLSGEIERLYQAYRAYIGVVQSSVMIMVYISLAFASNPQFTMFVAVGGMLSNLIYNKLYKKTKIISYKITADSHRFHGLVLQEMTHFKYLRATGQVYKYVDKLKKSIKELADGYRVQGFYNSLLLATREPLVIAVVVLIILTQIMYLKQEMGPIILSLLFFYRSLTLIFALQSNWNSFINVSGSMANYKNFLAELKGNQTHFLFGHSINRIDNIKLANVSFSYDGEVFLKNINLEVLKNKTIALVGASGSGKTTLINILTGLLPIDGGEFNVNGQAVVELNLHTYQSRLGYITQEPVIFNDTVFNNVTFWSEKSPGNLSRFTDALRKASLLRFVDSLDQKEDAILGNNGVLISGFIGLR
jgi:subfamily B ATP-binding cassette protein MsbA